MGRALSITYCGMLALAQKANTPDAIAHADFKELCPFNGGKRMVGGLSQY